MNDRSGRRLFGVLFFKIHMMAENKKSFVLYADSSSLVKQLPDDVAGRLFKHILAYVNDENPLSDELLLNVAFEPFKAQLKRDLQKWEKTKEVRSTAGKASAEAKKIAKEIQQNSTKTTNVEFVEINSTKSTVSDSVSVSVNVNDNVLNEFNKKNTPPSFSFFNEMIKFGFEKKLIEEWIKVRKSKRLVNTETAFKKFIKEVEKTRIDKNVILTFCIEKSWGGFESSWYFDKSNHENPMNSSTFNVNSNGKGILNNLTKSTNDKNR